MARTSDAKPARRRGRPKGARGKITNEAKQAILMAFDKLGGVDRLVAWVKEDKANETLFWTRIFPKLLPRPAIDAPPPPEPAPVFKGALTWKTPDWAKKANKELLRSGIAQVGGSRSEPAGRTKSGAPPPDGADREEG